eukprot:957451-Amphidinium_carterae.1
MYMEVIHKILAESPCRGQHLAEKCFKVWQRRTLWSYWRGPQLSLARDPSPLSNECHFDWNSNSPCGIQLNLWPFPLNIA